MTLMNEISGAGRTITATIILGLILWMLIKRLPNHTTTQDFGMYFDLLIVLWVLQFFLIIYISVTDYIHIYKDAYGKREVHDKQDFLSDIIDDFYILEPGIKLDIFMFILYIIIVIITILIILLRLTDEGVLKVENFSNPLSFGICFLKENGYSIFVYMNIFMFFYITRFIMKEINILSPDEEKLCSGSYASSCFTEKQINQYKKIKVCNDTFKELKCENDDTAKPYILEGCAEIEPGYLQASYDNESKLNINLIGNKLILDPSLIPDLGYTCSKNIQELLTKIQLPDTDDESNTPTGEEVSQGMDSLTEKLQDLITPGQSGNSPD